MNQQVLLDALTSTGLLILLFSAMHDVAVRTVPNACAVALFITGVALRFASGGLPVLETGFVVALITFAVTFLFWRLGWMGGGDVKLLAAAAIFVAPRHVPLMIAATALAGGILALLYVAGKIAARRPAGVRPSGMLPRIMRCELWRLHRGGPLPYALAIAAGGVFATLHA